jgi:hypothetical protein
MEDKNKNREEWKEVPISCSIQQQCLFDVQSKGTCLFKMEHGRGKCPPQSVQFCSVLFPVVGVLEIWSADEKMIRRAGCPPTHPDLSSWLPSPSRCLSCGFHTNFEKGQAYDGWVLCSLWVQQKQCYCMMGWSVMKTSILSALPFLFKQYLMETGCAQFVSTKGSTAVGTSKVSKKKESLVSQNWVLFLTYLILGYDACHVGFSLAKSFTILWGCLATSFEILLGCLRCCTAFNIQESDIWDRWAKTASLNLVCFLPRLGTVVIDVASCCCFHFHICAH